MDNPKPVDSPSMHTHRRQLAWQILVPIFLATALVLTVAVMVAIGTGSGTRTWADISTIWLIAPLLVFALFGVVLLGFLIYAINRLLQVTPRYTNKLQGFIGQIPGRTRSLSDGAVKPFIWFHQAGAILRTIFKS